MAALRRATTPPVRCYYYRWPIDRSHGPFSLDKSLQGLWRNSPNRTKGVPKGIRAFSFLGSERFETSVFKSCPRTLVPSLAPPTWTVPRLWRYDPPWRTNLEGKYLPLPGLCYLTLTQSKGNWSRHYVGRSHCRSNSSTLRPRLEALPHCLQSSSRHLSCTYFTSSCFSELISDTL